ncbi:MAG: low molecular weight phosphotyrosine protein phosphatase [Deltaproteobacteria bacterium]|nr:low molecular weight phosphotyrosine protein phosphatase [Deltaproteobacteria bacterium]
MKGRIQNILFVCTGNICRSPFAGALTNKLLQGSGLEGVCANTAGLCVLPDNAATAMAARVASEYAIDLSDHKAKMVSKELLAWCDLVLVMEKSHKQEILESFPEASGKTLLLRHFARCGSRTRGIADPYGLRYESYRFCFLDIHDAISGLAEYLNSEEKAF